jgi:hypothetical protein
MSASLAASLISVAELVGIVGTAKGVRFISLTHTAKRNGEIARHTILIGCDYGHMLATDLATATEMLPSLSGIEAIACQEIIDSLSKSIACAAAGIVNPDYTCADVYVHLQGVKGVKVHKDTGEMYLEGMSQAKVVLEAGTPDKPVKSSDKTLAKRHIEKSLRKSHYRTFSLAAVKGCRVNGEVLEIDA